MAKRSSRFSQAEVTRAVKAFASTGLQLAEVCIEPNGTIVLVAAGGEATESDDSDWREGSPLYTPDEAESPRAYSTRSLADRWQCSTGHIRNMIARGELRSFRYGNLIRITAEAVAEVEAKRR